LYSTVLFLIGSPAKGAPVTSHNTAKDTEKGKSNLPPDISLWTVTEVVSFFSSLGFPEEAKSFQNQVNMHEHQSSLFLFAHFLKEFMGLMRFKDIYSWAV